MVDMQQQLKHVSIILGDTCSGKDTFILNLDLSLEKKSMIIDNEVVQYIQLGDDDASCTKKFKNIYYENQQINNSPQKFILNTVGFGDAQMNFTDTEICVLLLKKLVEETIAINGGINVFYFVHSLENVPVTNIEKVLQRTQIVLNQDIFKSSVIIATKGNLVTQDNYEDRMETLKQIAQKYQIRGGVVDFRCQYKRKGIGELKNPVDTEKAKAQWQNLISSLQQLEFFNLNVIYQEIENKKIELAQLLKENKYTITISEEKLVKFIERRWYTFFLWPHEIQRTATVVKKIQTKFDQQIELEAQTIVIQQKLDTVKKQLDELKDIN